MFENVPTRLADAVQNMPDSLRDEGTRYTTAAAFVIAEYVNVQVIGPTMHTEYVDLKEDSTGAIWYGFGVRLTMIGETLFLLRSCPGFHELCRRLRERDFRSAFFETLSARLFFDAGFEIEAQPERQIREQDFDFRAVRQDTSLNIEVTGLTPPQFSLSTLRNALNQKRKQLPADSPGIICCVHPESWFKYRDLSFGLMHVSYQFFSRTGRVNAVVFLSEIHITHPNPDIKEGGIIATKETIPNLSPRVSVPLDFLFRHTRVHN
jgi:hypothetical protein